MLRVDERVCGQAVLFTLEGELSAGRGAALLLERLQALLRENLRCFVFDMRDVRYINSSGVDLLRQAQFAIDKHCGTLAMVNLSHVITKVLLDINLIDTFKRFATVEEAIKQLGEQDNAAHGRAS